MRILPSIAILPTVQESLRHFLVDPVLKIMQIFTAVWIFPPLPLLHLIILPSEFVVALVNNQV